MRTLRARTVFWARLCCVFALLVVQPTSLLAARIWFISKKKPTIRVRLFVELPQIPVTTMGRNQQVFVANQELPHGASKVIKVSYDYLYYEAHFPAQQLDSDIIYELRAQRDASCDESLSSVGSQLRADNSMSSVEIALESASSQILECYRTMPGDYRSRHKVKSK